MSNTTSSLGQILFIGEFPPPYTGVTTKDSLLVNEVLSDFDVECFNLYRFKFEKVKFPALCVQLLAAIRRAERICIGVGHPFRTCMIFRIARVLRGRAFLNNITVFMMGIGTPGYVRKHPGNAPYLAQGRCIFTESETLNAELAELGVPNTRYLPNFRKGEGARAPQAVGQVVRFVYFAKVCREKGAHTLLAACAALNAGGLAGAYAVAIYGHVAPEFAAEFDELRQDLANVEYKGVFDAVEGDVLAELNQYDASSSSSSWREGMSGTNIECKFAGVANIVGDGGLNAECVADGVDGFVVPAGNVEALAGAMRRVICDHELLARMKQASYDSRTVYDVAAWKDEVVRVVA